MTSLFIPRFLSLNFGRVVSLVCIKDGQLLYGTVMAGRSSRHDRWWVNGRRVFSYHHWYYLNLESGCVNPTIRTITISISDRLIGPSLAIAGRGPKVEPLRTGA